MTPMRPEPRCSVRAPTQNRLGPRCSVRAPTQIGSGRSRSGARRSGRRTRDGRRRAPRGLGRPRGARAAGQAGPDRVVSLEHQQGRDDSGAPLLKAEKALAGAEAALAQAAAERDGAMKARAALEGEVELERTRSPHCTRAPWLRTSRSASSPARSSASASSRHGRAAASAGPGARGRASSGDDAGGHGRARGRVRGHRGRQGRTAPPV